MQKFILAALFIGAVSTTGCAVDADDEGSFTESALKGGKFADGGAGKPAKAEKDGGKSKRFKAKKDGGKGKPVKFEKDGGKGKSGEDHGKSDVDEDELDDEDALQDEDALEDESLTP
ncbi:MAG TPA: hypothetical protein VFX59_13040 [Polyangiales bacterium]|nr:hypothetical protein [Polyangiales bacterium]